MVQGKGGLEEVLGSQLWTSLFSDAAAISGVNQWVEDSLSRINKNNTKMRLNFTSVRKCFQSSTPSFPVGEQHSLQHSLCGGCVWQLTAASALLGLSHLTASSCLWDCLTAWQWRVAGGLSC